MRLNLMGSVQVSAMFMVGRRDEKKGKGKGHTN